MKRSEIKDLIVYCIENMDDMSESDAGSVKSYAHTFKAKSNLSWSSVESLQRIVERIKRRKAGIPAPKPIN